MQAASNTRTNVSVSLSETRYFCICICICICVCTALSVCAAEIRAVFVPANNWQSKLKSVRGVSVSESVPSVYLYLPQWAHFVRLSVCVMCAVCCVLCALRSSVRVHVRHFIIEMCASPSSKMIMRAYRAAPQRKWPALPFKSEPEGAAIKCVTLNQ